MNLKELNEKIEFCMKKASGNENVVITLKQPSIGSRAFVELRFASMGFDWEAGQFRLEPTEPLIKYAKDRDVPTKPRIGTITYGDKKRSVIKCPVCAYKLNKKFNYCPSCGQRILLEEKRTKNE